MLFAKLQHVTDLLTIFIFSLFAFSTDSKILM
jgi:hypothetical protein